MTDNCHRASSLKASQKITSKTLLQWW